MLRKEGGNQKGGGSLRKGGGSNPAGDYAINPDDAAILNIHCVDYYCNIHGISKNEAASLLQNADLTGKRGAFYKNKKTYYRI